VLTDRGVGWRAV
jgi:hypothetical protein